MYPEQRIIVKVEKGGRLDINILLAYGEKIFKNACYTDTNFLPAQYIVYLQKQGVKMIDYAEIERVYNYGKSNII